MTHNSKTNRIERIKQILDPRPEFVLFRRTNETPPGCFNYQGKVLTREECLEIPAKRAMFLTHQVVDSRYEQETDTN